MYIAASRLAAAFARPLCGQKLLSHPPRPFFWGGRCLHLHFSIHFRWHLHSMVFSFANMAIVKRSGLLLLSIPRRQVGAFLMHLDPVRGGRHADPLLFQGLPCLLHSSDLHFPPENKKEVGDRVTASIPFSSIYILEALYICILLHI